MVFKMSMRNILPLSVGFGKKNLPQTACSFAQTYGMTCKDTHAVLWANVRQLMIHKYGKENLTRLSRESGCGPGTMTRIKEQKTSVGLDVLGKISEVFGLCSWQLLTPDLDPANPPVIWLTRSERDLYTRLKVISSELAKQ